MLPKRLLSNLHKRSLKNLVEKRKTQNCQNKACWIDCVVSVLEHRVFVAKLFVRFIVTIGIAITVESYRNTFPMVALELHAPTE